MSKFILSKLNVRVTVASISLLAVIGIIAYTMNRQDEKSTENIEETPVALSAVTGEKFKLAGIESIPEGEWQAEKSFPDQAGYVDNTLAMNSMYSFTGFSGQAVCILRLTRELSLSIFLLIITLSILKGLLRASMNSILRGYHLMELIPFR
ncbi:hypothetical protein [Butyrivibrio sp. AE3004]|uniref:hypothetical protein n=1 Tax=Butyrivibrio sp. AE3004 TaxID=1506994 RepID=UPI00068B189F|nr:hypothetical protein [Butyrivibrio sp. AE3004]